MTEDFFHWPGKSWKNDSVWKIAAVLYVFVRLVMCFSADL